MKIKILIIDDHPLFREALAAALAHSFDVDVFHASTIEDARCRIAATPGLDLVLLDLKISGNSIFSGLATLRRDFPAVRVLVVSAFEHPGVVMEIRRHGAAGFVAKSNPAGHIIESVARVLGGQDSFPPALPDAREPAGADLRYEHLAERLDELTVQQRRVLSLLREGRLNKQIAGDLGIAERTVKSHVSAILGKFGVASRTQAVIVANRLVELGLLD